MPEDAGQLNCLQARMPGADDQDVLRAAMSEVAPEIEGFLKRDPAAKRLMAASASCAARCPPGPGAPGTGHGDSRGGLGARPCRHAADG